MSVQQQSGGQDPVENGGVSYDECFDLLSNHRRRYALHYLKYNGDSATLGELSDHVAAWENNVDVDDITYDERKRVYTSLQQVHLPRMDTAGVVEFDDREGVVELTPEAEELDVYLEVVRDRDVPWSVFYLALVAINAAFVGLAALGVPGFAGVPGLGWALFAVTTFAVAAGAHLYVTKTEMHLGESELPPELEE